MANVLTVGIFNVSIVEIGEKYGNGAVNNYSEPLVVFHDNRFVRPDIGWVHGQQVSSYLVSTMLERNSRYGLNLDGGIPEWSVSASDMNKVSLWLNEYLLQSVEF